MATPKGFIRDLAGQIVPFGQNMQVREASFAFGEPLPSWLSVSSGTGASVAHSTAGAGYYMVKQNAATSGETAALATAPIPMNQYTGILFEVEGLQWENSWTAALPANLLVGLQNLSPEPSAGGWLIHRSTDPTAKLGIAGQSSDKEEAVGYEMRTSGQANKKRNVGVLILPQTKELFAFESGLDGILGWRDGTGVMSDGLIRGQIRSTTLEAAQHPIRLTGVRLTLWQN